jgi:dTDP-4-dehydrorhamnose 3,5-epimerase
MNFLDTALPGIFEIQIEPHFDERGFFARTWCRNELEQRGLSAEIAQCSVSFNPKEGTLRGLHYQVSPHAETKLVRCTKGSIFDVVLDLRPSSPKFKQWIGVTLTAENRKMIYIPEGCAHGFLTLEDDTEVFYQISEFYDPKSSRGVRWNDAAFQINWPSHVHVISERDRSFPDFR